MNLHPLGKRYLVELEAECGVEKGGIFIPDSVRKVGCQRGLVLAVGLGFGKGESPLKRGDVVLVQRQAALKEYVNPGDTIRDGRRKLYVADADEVLAKVSDE